VLKFIKIVLKNIIIFQIEYLRMVQYFYGDNNCGVKKFAKFSLGLVENT
jgi:hypothetical protein